MHKKSYKYKKRLHKNSSFPDRAVLLKKDEAVKIFEKYGWIWGGDFSPYKDYQHFSK